VGATMRVRLLMGLLTYRTPHSSSLLTSVGAHHVLETQTCKVYTHGSALLKSQLQYPLDCPSVSLILPAITVIAGDAAPSPEPGQADGPAEQ
jgi:hypothetical protein